MARLRLCAAYAAYWNGHPERSADLARSGLGYLADGENAAQLHLLAGLAAARAGDADSARQAIAAAHSARDREHRDELLEIGGEFGFSRATQSYYAGFVLSEAGAGEAAAELEAATGLYAAGPGPGEQHSRQCQMLAHTDLAIARLRAGALDAAIAALTPVLALPPAERTAVQGQRLSAVRAELAQPVYRGSAQARGLAEQVAGFAPDELGSLPGQEGVGQAWPEGGQACPEPRSRTRRPTVRCGGRGQRGEVGPDRERGGRELAQEGGEEGREQPVLRRLVQGGPGHARAGNRHQGPLENDQGPADRRATSPLTSPAGP
jgi:hypothetical protein